MLGGLSVGLQPTSFEVPVMQNEEPPFEYPRAAWKDRVGGETLLRIHISPGGAVDSVLVEVSSGHRGLDSAAVVGARRLRYRPARRGGEPMAVWATLPVRYPMPAGMSGGP
ncbi:MAG: TonB family protein [Gemmatimonadota bacterium]